jgi:hypothetical protein
MQNLLKQGLSMLVGGLVVAGVLAATQARAQDELAAAAAETLPATVVEAAAPVAPVLSYQGQLLDPFTGLPKPNGGYPMVFSIYAQAGGTALWTESKSVQVTDGYFATLLGDTAPLNLNIFNGQVLLIGVQVGLDPEATPRQRLAYAPYALYAGNADTLDGLDSSAFARVGDVGGGPLAFGFVDENGNRGVGSNNWSSQFVDQGGNARGYLIQIDGEDFQFRNYVVQATPACGNVEEARMANVGSTNGRLLVEFVDQNGNRERCDFYFTVIKP